MDGNQIENKIIDSVKSHNNVSVIKEFKSSSKENETLFFLKPEFFHIKNLNSIRLLITFILKKINDFNIDISGIVTLSGSFLKKSRIIERHYGFINKFSVKGSLLVNDEQKEKIKEVLSIKDLYNHKILGGHEVINRYKNVDDKMLTEMWYSKKSIRIGEGFYIQPHYINDENVILINGFHPNQIQHYTNTDSRIVLFLLQTDTDWIKLRNNFVGDTFPENAIEGSIRATLYKNAVDYGIENINVANNFVHASSGPFDALFEICNFVGSIESINYCYKNTNIYNLMKDKYNLPEPDFQNALNNPCRTVDGKETDLFSYTKNKNTFSSISDYIMHFREN